MSLEQYASAVKKPVQQLMLLRSNRERLAPSPPGQPLWGHLPELRRDPLGAMVRWRRQVGDVVRLRFGPILAHLVASPEHVRHVLVEQQRRFDKQTRGFAAVRLILGNGLLTSEGDFWRRQRRIAQPAFHRDRIAAFAETMTRAAEDARERLIACARDEQTVDAAAEMMRLTLRIASETLLSTDVSRDADAVGGAVTELLGQFNDRVRRPVFVPLWIPTPENKRVQRAIASLDRVVNQTVALRRKTTDKPNDLLTMLMEAEDAETGETMSDAQLRDEVLTIFLAGHETTANALAWTLYLLSLHPGIRRRLEGELDRVLCGRTPGLDDLRDLPLCRDIIQEAMRLYPPAWMIGRRAVESCEIGGYFVPADGLVLVSPYVTHRHPDLWDNPEGFDPDRWRTQRVADLPRGAYFPFGLGPRICIGQSFANMEAALVLATLCSRLRFDLVDAGTVTAEPTVTLRPKGGVRMRPYARPVEWAR